MVGNVVQLSDEVRADARARRIAALKLQYTGRAKVNIVGPATGTVYQFAWWEPVQAVDILDAPAILRTNLFRRAR